MHAMECITRSVARFLGGSPSIFSRIKIKTQMNSCACDSRLASVRGKHVNEKSTHSVRVKPGMVVPAGKGGGVGRHAGLVFKRSKRSLRAFFGLSSVYFTRSTLCSIHSSRCRNSVKNIFQLGPQRRCYPKQPPRSQQSIAPMIRAEGNLRKALAWVNYMWVEVE